MNIFKNIYYWFVYRRQEKLLKKRFEELRKKDPFIYK